MRISDWSSDVCSSDLAVTAAYAGLGLWALVIQRIVTEIISTLLSRASYRWTPGWAFRWPTLKRNLSINGSLTATQLVRSEEHTSELQSLMRTSYAVYCLKKKIIHITRTQQSHQQ